MLYVYISLNPFRGTRDLGSGDQSPGPRVAELKKLKTSASEDVPKQVLGVEISAAQVTEMYFRRYVYTILRVFDRIFAILESIGLFINNIDLECYYFNLQVNMVNKIPATLIALCTLK